MHGAADTGRRHMAGGGVFWLTAIFLGAGGGTIVSAVRFCADMSARQEERRAQKRLGRLPLLAITQFIDPWPDLWVLLTRAILGAAAAYVFRGEVTGHTAAIAVGASAPAILAQFGRRPFPDPLPDPEAEPKSADKNKNIEEIQDPVPRQRLDSREITPLPEEA